MKDEAWQKTEDIISITTEAYFSSADDINFLLWA